MKDLLELILGGFVVIGSFIFLMFTVLIFSPWFWGFLILIALIKYIN